MSNLVDHVLMNKLDDELSKAINEVGGDTSSARGPWDYPNIIKEQLGTKNANVDLIAGPGIIIRERNGKKFICSTSGALTTGALNPPSGSYKQPISEVIEAGTPVQEVFETLFYKILPRMSSVYKGDIIRSDKHGADRYNEEDTRTGLVPDSTYMRLYVANRQEPVYVLLSGHGLVNEEGDLGSGGSKDPIEYVGSSSEYITVSVTGNVITASINEFGLEKMKALADRISAVEDKMKSLEDSVGSYDSKIEAVEGLVDEISDKSKEMESKFIQYDAEFTAMNTELDTKAASSELKKLEENTVSKTAYNSDMLTLNTKVNSVSSDIATTNTKINNLSGQVVEVRNSMSEVEAIAARAESISGSTMESVNALTSNVDALESSVVSVTQTINAVSQNVTNVEQSVSQVSQNVNELQQTSVTKEEVNTMVSQEVTNVVNNTEVVDGKVKDKLIEALGDPEDEEVQEALNAAVNKVMEDNSVTDGSSIADDIFAGL